MIQVLDHIKKMLPYVPPWGKMDRKTYIRMDLNENTNDPPAPVMEALSLWAKSGRFQMYPDYGQFMPELARYAGAPEDRLLVTNGSDQAISITLRAFLNPGDTLVIAEPGFPIFAHEAGIIGAKVRAVPFEKDLSFPYAAFEQALAGADLAVFITPNNPTGTPVDPDFILRVLATRPDLPVIVDEAYFEFTGQTLLPRLDEFDNLIIFRTFSKAFAMAGLRLGYLAARPELITQLSKVRGVFDVNAAALVVAEAQMKDPAPAEAFVDEAMTKSMPFLLDFFKSARVDNFPGTAHFLLVRPKDRDGAVARLKQAGFLVRPMTAPLIADTFRMNVGTLDQTRRFAAAFQKWLDTSGK